MADGKENNLDSINQIDEEESLQKANAKESLDGPEEREEHFKQNIMMEVDEFPASDDAAQEVVSDERVAESEQHSKEQGVQESQSNIVVDESAIYVAENNIDEDTAFTPQSDIHDVKSDSANQSGEVERQSAAGQAADKQVPENDVVNSAFQSLDVDQEIEEAILFSPDNDDKNQINDSNNAPEAFDSSATADEDNVLNGQLFARDDDANDTLTYSVISQPESGSVVVNDDGSYSFFPGDEFQTLGVGDSQDVVFTYQVQDESGATDTAEMVITVTGSNDGPVASTPNQNSNEDNVLNGQLSASDIEGDDLTYSLLVDAGEGDVAISADGTFTFNPADEFQDLADGETRDVTFTYQVQDENDAIDTQEVTITVTGKNDAPVGMFLSNTTISENVDGGIIGDLSTNDVDVSDTHTYSVDDPRFEVVNDINGTPQLKLINSESLDFESEPSVTITVTTTDESGQSFAQAYNISVNDANEFDVSAVTDSDNTTNEAGESVAVGASVGITAFAEDQDGSNSDVTYSLSSNPGNAFSINADTGEVTVNDPSQLDFETAQSMQIEVTATSEDGSTSSETFNIAINDANEFDVSAVTDSDTATNEVSESAIAGASVGVTAFAEDLDGTANDVTYSLSSNPGNAFNIDPDTGEVTVNDPSQLDFESAQSMQIEVTATSQDNSTSAQTFDISINDANEFDINAVTDSDAATNEVSESASVGDSVGVTAFAEDLDGSTNDVTYSLTNNPNNAFAIDADTGEVTVNDPSQLDFETAQSMQIEVTATSEDGSTSAQTFDIAINDANEFDVSAVTDSDTATNEVSESAIAGASVGVTAFAEDLDGTVNDVTYSLSSNPGNAFNIDPDTGEVTVNDPSQLDFESAQSMQIEVTATSQDNSTSAQTFDISINDANEFDINAVTDSDAATNEVNESASVGDSVGVTAFAEDLDGTTNNVTYSLSSNPGNAFNIDPDTGEVTVNDPSQLDFESAQSMQIEVTATSQDGSTSSETFDIAINDANEFEVSAVTDSDATTNEVSESASVGDSVGVTAFAEDLDGSTNDVTYSLTNNPNNAFAIDADTGEVTVNDPSQLDFESAQSMQIKVTATSDDGSTSTESFNIAINDANEFDISGVTDSDNAANEVTESAAVGASVGVTAFAEDLDGTTNDVTYSLSSNPNNAFAIDADTGEVTVNDPSQLDFETAQSMQIEVTATSQDGSTSSETFDIAINDANEFEVSAVTDSDATTNEVSESAIAGASVGVTAFAEDLDGAANDVTYSLSSNPNNAFAINAETGEVTVADPSGLDFETSQTMRIEVTATSEDGSTSAQTFDIAINDADEFDVSAVIDSDNTTNEVSESAGVGASVGVTAFAEDLDGSNSDVTYSLSSNPGNAFSINANTGEVTVNDPSQLDFETAQSMQIEVTATSEDGSSNQATFVIGVNDVNEGANVSVSDASGDEDTTIALDMQLTEVEPGATVSITIDDVPAGAVLSAGTDNGDGSWTLDQSDLSGLTITPPENSDVDFSLSITTNVTEHGVTESYDNSINVTVDAVADAPSITVVDSNSVSEVFESTFEVGVGNGSTLFVSSADGWVAGSEAIEIRNENQHAGEAAEGDQFIELNSSTYYDDASIVQRTVDTEEGSPYELNFQVSPRPGAEQYSDFIVQAIDVSTGDVLKTMEVNWDGNPVSELTWETHSFQFVGTGGDVQLVFQDSGQTNTYGRGALIDDIQFGESSGVDGSEPIDLSSLIAVGGVDTDGSESISIEFDGLPDAATLMAAGGEIVIENGVADISLEDLASLQLSMPAGFTGDLNFDVSASSTERATGETVTSTESMSIKVVSNDENLDSLGANTNDSLSGTSSDDTLYGGSGDDVVSGGAGDDILYGGSGDDTVNGGDGNDMLLGGDGSDTLNGGAGEDFIQGGDGEDTIDGGSGDDVIYGGSGDDSQSGGDGSDIFIFDGGDGSDVVDGGAGSDWVDSIDLSGYTDGAVDPSSPWQIEVDGEAVDYDINAGLLELGSDVSGVIQFDDGSQLTFDNIENIEW